MKSFQDTISTSNQDDSNARRDYNTYIRFQHLSKTILTLEETTTPTSILDFIKMIRLKFTKGIGQPQPEYQNSSCDEICIKRNLLL
ncbi:hypothetical protein QE152_g32115 [Popillia japonica]|uniref:Uncharacterized protein n=1 Tax=Popillia japonica TaxID=7064 RepID=A0AAW1IZV2_POPJA